MNNLFQVLTSSIKAKITPLVTKFKLWTSGNFIRTKVVTAIRTFFVSIFDVKPKHKKDYYEVFNWLVSKKLAFAGVVIVGVLSFIYLYTVFGSAMPWANKTAGIKTYNYNSVMLRIASGKVQIKGKSGYMAYLGDVKRGYVTGSGELYDPKGNLVYQGKFSKNQYEGNGTLYYKSGSMKYQGNFSANLYEGSGKLYRENGSLYYDGSFSKGLKDGTGKLYDTGNNQVFEGSFSADELVYSEFLGKTTADVAKAYSGERTVYEDDSDFTVIMSDIDAAYVGTSNTNALDDEVKVDSVYVMKDYFPGGTSRYGTIADVESYFGEPDYEGNSTVSMTEAIAINQVVKTASNKGNPVEMDESATYDDYHVVNSYDQTRSVYLYAFRQQGLIYTFVCNDRNSNFLFYYIEKEDGGAS